MENPYQSSIHGGAPPPPPSGSGVTIGTVQGLAATKPWVRFCAILGFIAGGLMAVFGVIAMVSMAFVGGNIGAQEVGVLVGLGAVYLLLSAIHLVPAFRLWKYGTAILNLMMSGSVADLDKALEHHRSFWRFVGILMIIGTVISILMFTATSVVPSAP